MKSELPSPGKRAEIRALEIVNDPPITSNLTILISGESLRLRAKGSILSILLPPLWQLLDERWFAYFENGQIHFPGKKALGVALDLGEGLKVCLADGKELADPASAEKTLRKMALGYLGAPQALSYLAVTDLSALDIYFFRPVLHGRQSLVLGVGGDRLAPGAPYTLTATFDHRVHTGMQVASLLRDLRDALS